VRFVRLQRTIALIVAIVCAAPLTGLARPAKKSKVSNLTSCPAWGSETRGKPRALLNEVKRRVPTGSTAARLDVAAFVTLQQQADARVTSGPDSNFSAAQRAQLRDLPVGDLRVSEGDLVALSGFVVGKPHGNVGESVNCYLSGPANNDFEISIGAEPRSADRAAITVEMIPQDRPQAWTLPRLRRLASDGRRVLVFGQLMFDSHHKMGDRPRVSLWEVHPITRFLVCQRPDNGCDPNDENAWVALETIPER